MNTNEYQWDINTLRPDEYGKYNKVRSDPGNSLVPNRQQAIT